MEDQRRATNARRGRLARLRSERGTAVVEFALVVPILMTILLAAFSGGLAYSQRQAMTGAAREAARLGATLPVSAATGGTLNGWLTDVATAAEQAATGDLKAGTEGRRICVAYVHPAGTDPADVTTMLVRTTSGDTFSNPAGSAACFSGGDGRPAGERRVQVVVERTGHFETLVYSKDITLKGKALSFFEAASS